MQTTLRINDVIFREAKAEAAREGMTLTRFLEEALSFRMRVGRQCESPVGVDLPVFDSGKRLAASYDLTSAIRAADEEQDGKIMTGLGIRRKKSGAVGRRA
jgi:hypothetical protein